MIRSKLVNDIFDGMARFISILISKEVVVPYRFETGEVVDDRVVENFKVLTDALKSGPVFRDLEGLSKDKVYLMKVKVNTPDKCVEEIVRLTERICRDYGIVIFPICGVEYELLEAVEISEKIVKLQQVCKHKDVTDWISFAWDGRRKDGKARFCRGCGKIVEKS